MTDIEKAEYEDVLRRLTAKCEELVAENARLRSSENNAHAVLREVYNDPTASPAVRVKAAGLALPHEVPRLTPQPPALELTAEPIMPLAEVVRLQRARADRMMPSPDRCPLPLRSITARRPSALSQAARPPAAERSSKSFVTSTDTCRWRHCHESFALHWSIP